MISTVLKKRLITSLMSLTTKYDMFYTNHQYKNMHFKSEEEYKSVQLALSSELQIEENIAKDILIQYFRENFPNVQFVLYDSRTICMTNIRHRIGRILLKGLGENQNEINEVKQTFNADTDLTVEVSRWEDLDEESQKQLTEYFKL